MFFLKFNPFILTTPNLLLKFHHSLIFNYLATLRREPCLFDDLTFFASKIISVRASILIFPPELDKLMSEPEVMDKDLVGDDNLEILNI